MCDGAEPVTCIREEGLQPIHLPCVVLQWQAEGGQREANTEPLPTAALLTARRLLSRPCRGCTAPSTHNRRSCKTRSLAKRRSICALTITCHPPTHLGPVHQPRSVAGDLQRLRHRAKRNLAKPAGGRACTRIQAAAFGGRVGQALEAGRRVCRGGFSVSLGRSLAGCGKLEQPALRGFPAHAAPSKAVVHGAAPCFALATACGPLPAATAPGKVR